MTLDLDRRGARRKHGRDGEAIKLEEGYSDEQEFEQEARAAHGFDERLVLAQNQKLPPWQP